MGVHHGFRIGIRGGYGDSTTGGWLVEEGSRGHVRAVKGNVVIWTQVQGSVSDEEGEVGA